MRSKFMRKAAVLAAGVLAMGILLGTSGQAVYAAESKGKITVSGEGTVKVKPDMATIYLGISTEDADAKVAQTKNAEKMNNIIAAVKALGISDKDIQTSNYSMYPQMDYQNGNKITGYTVNNNLSIIVRNIDQAGAVLDTAVSAGANLGNGIQFGISDSSAYYEEALTLAIQNATVKGKAIAKALGQTVGLPIEIIESGGSYMPVASAGMAKASMRDEAAATPVEAGELEVAARIQAVFEY